MHVSVFVSAKIFFGPWISTVEWGDVIGLVSVLVAHLLCEVGRCAECTAHAEARLKASGMAITAAGRRK